MTMLERGLRDATYYEEKVIGGIWYFRTNPDHPAFFPMNEAQLARKIAQRSFEPRTMRRQEIGEVAIRERRAKISPSPWEYQRPYNTVGQVVERSSGGQGWICQLWTKCEEPMDNERDNGNFIAHAPEDIDRLLATCDSLRAERASEMERESKLVTSLELMVATARSDAISECIEKVKGMRSKYEKEATVTNDYEHSASLGTAAAALEEAAAELGTMLETQAEEK